MKKHFAKFTLLFAAAAFMASCSSDEPKGGNNELPQDVTGMTAYMSVNIQDATSRAEGDAEGDAEAPKDKEYEYGSTDESYVANAKFYFYTAEKVFMQEGTLADFKPTTGTEANVEVLGQKVLVLKGLTTNTTPTYLLTVLNAPEGFDPGATLDDTRNALINSVINGDGNFIMSTTSFGDATTDEYGTNQLTTNDFLLQAAGTVTPDDIFETTEGLHTVDIYVERLAAKVEVSFPKTNADGYIELTAPVAGNPNELDDASALSTVYVKFSKWALNGTLKTSYLTKHLPDADLQSAWKDWQKADYHRSFWGQSTAWGNELTTDNANFITYNEATLDPKDESGESVFDYCAENTNELKKVAQEKLTIDGNLTHVIFTAKVYEKQGDEYTALDLIRYNGNLFKKEWFKQFALNYLKVNNKLNYYSRIKDTENEGTNDETTKYHFEQLGPDALKLDFELTGHGTGMVKLVSKLTEADNLEYWAKDEYGDFHEASETMDDEAIAKLNKDLAEFDNNNGVTVEMNAYTDGCMYYKVPIKHLRDIPTDGKLVEGNYGVVRNHWYKVSVNNVFRLGYGVFAPDSKDDIIKPETKPEDPNYYLGCNIKILSWRIVNQNVDL